MKSLISNAAQDQMVNPGEGTTMPTVLQTSWSFQRVFKGSLILCFLALAASSCTKNPGEVKCLGCDEPIRHEIPIILDGSDQDSTNIVIDDTLVM